MSNNTSIKSIFARKTKLYPKEYKNCLADEINWVIKSVPKSNSLIDIGCGDGRLTKVLSNKTKNYVGVDIDYRAINKAKSIFKNEKFIVRSAESLPCFKNNEFEISVCLWNTIGNITHHKKALKEIYRITSKRCFISTIEKGNLSIREKYYKSMKLKAKINQRTEVIQSGAWGIARAYSVKDLSKMARDSGFKVNKVVKIGSIGFGLELLKN